MSGLVTRKVSRRFRVRKRSNSVALSLQEIYLRDDLPCRSSLCNICSHNSPTRLPSDVSHYLVPDADTLLKYWEILELPQFIGVIYLASVLKEVHARSNQRSWRRLRLLFQDKRRHTLYYDDDHSIYAWTLSNGFSKGGIHYVAAWFYAHLEGKMPIIIITDSGPSAEGQVYDVAKEFAKMCTLSSESSNLETIMEMSSAEYFGRFWSHDASITDLYLSLVQAAIETKDCGLSITKENSGTTTNQETLYREYLSGSEIELGISSGDLRVGVFHASNYSPTEAFVRPSNKGEASLLEILVPGRKLQNRALHGDIVVVRVLSKNIEKVKPDDPDQDSIFDGSENDLSRLTKSLNCFEEDDEGTEKDSGSDVVKGEIVGILQRAHRDYVACLDESEEKENLQSNSNRQEHLLCVPMDQRIPLVRCSSRQRGHLVGQRFVIRIDGWDISSSIPRGHIVRILGPIGDINTENTALLIENDINISNFSVASLEELPQDTVEHPWLIPTEEFSNRRDLRTLHRAFSIDPPGSRDVDDVLSVCHLPNNLIEVGVHIADVSFFVKQDSQLDLEARARGTTVYLVGKTYHMLPSILSENLCSLRQGEDRLAVSVIWTVNPAKEYEVLQTWFGRTIIRSSYQMTYAQAQAIYDDESLPEGFNIDRNSDDFMNLQSDLSKIANFAQNRRSVRESEGALEFVSTELAFDIDEDRQPSNVRRKQGLPMNWIVAEMMIFANSCVARQVYLTFPHTSLLRLHRPPKLDNFRLLSELCEARGFFLDVSSNKALADSLASLRRCDDPEIESAMRALLTRAMSEAEYVSSGDISDSSIFYHYGLALEFYTHFTSPIRRYADVIVHRQLVASVSLTENTHSISNGRKHSGYKMRHAIGVSESLKEVAEHLNQRNRASKRAQKQCNELHLLKYLENHAEAHYALVLETLEKGLFVFVPKYDLRGLVKLRDKNGNVILPLEKDENFNSSDGNHINHAQTSLKYESQSISIIDSSGSILYKYRRMAPVWVFLKADGSRARLPTLSIKLLSEKHPASVDAREAHISMPIRTLRLGSKDSQIVSRGRTTAMMERRKATDEMANIIAGSNASHESSSRYMENADAEKRMLTIHEAMEDVEKLLYNATSVFTSFEDKETMEDFAGLPPALDMTIIDESCNQASSSPALLGVSMKNYCVMSEDEKRASFRKLFQKNLFLASDFRTRYLYSILHNQESRQVRRLLKQREIYDICKRMLNVLDK